MLILQKAASFVLNTESGGVVTASPMQTRLVPVTGVVESRIERASSRCSEVRFSRTSSFAGVTMPNVRTHAREAYGSVATGDRASQDLIQAQVQAMSKAG